jgi:1-acyl-sn-glycerol-3-phosphate acyltransferase
MNLLYRFYWVALRIVTRLFLGLRRHGLDNFPDSGGVVIASNHLSVADPPIIGSALPRGIHYFAKAELFGKWYSPFLIETLNTIPVKRGRFDRQAFGTALDVVSRGNWLLVFPEGSRSKDGKLKEGKVGAAKIAVEAGVPVIPACVVNTHRMKKVIFSGMRVAVRFGRPIYPSEYSSIERDKEKLRKFTDDIMERIRHLVQIERESSGADLSGD